MPTKIFLVRHGQTEFNKVRQLQGQCNSPLTELGQKQAKSIGRALAEELKNESFTIYSSPLGRTKQTTSFICNATAYSESDVLVDERLMECAFGDWEEVLFSELQRTCPEELSHKDWYLRAPKGERYDDLIQRLESWLNDLPESGNIVAVSHGLLGLILRGHLSQMPYEDLWHQDIPQDAYFVIEDGKVTRVNVEVG